MSVVKKITANMKVAPYILCLIFNMWKFLDWFNFKWSILFFQWSMIVFELWLSVKTMWKFFEWSSFKWLYYSWWWSMVVLLNYDYLCTQWKLVCHFQTRWRLLVLIENIHIDIVSHRLVFEFFSFLLCTCVRMLQYVVKYLL